MIITLGADHRGFKLKERLKQVLASEGYQIEDCGASEYLADDDYPDYAKKVAEAVGKDPEGHRGIVICGSGFGVDIAANKFAGIRAALPMSPDHAYQARHDDDANVLALAADFVTEEDALKIIKTFLSTPFDKNERYERRLEKIRQSEKK